MNKKKRALTLGLAAAQLTSLTAVVAPLTAVTAFADTITISGTDYTVTLPDVTSANYTVTAAEDSDTSGNILITVTPKTGYVAGATVPSSSNVSGKTFEEVKDGDGKVTSWKLSFGPSGTNSYDFSDLSVTLLQEIAPTLSVTRNVDLSDAASGKTEAEDTNHQAALDAAKALTYTVSAGSDGVSLTDSDYDITCEWNDTNKNVVATLTLKGTAADNYVLASDVTCDVAVTYKTESQKTQVTVTPATSPAALSVTAAGADPTEDEVKTAVSALDAAALKALVTAKDGENAPFTDFTVALDTSGGGDGMTVNKSAKTVALALKVTLTDDTTAEFASGDGTLTVTLDYEKKATPVDIADVTLTNAVISFVDESDAPITSATDGQKIKMVVKGDTNYTVKAVARHAKFGAFTEDSKNKGTFVSDEYTVNATADTDAASSKLKYDAPSATIAENVTVTVGSITAVQLTATNKESASLDAADVTAIQTAVNGALTFAGDASGSVTPTKDTDYTIGTPTFTKGSTTVKVTVASAGNTYAFADEEVTVTVKFAKIAVTAPTLDATKNAADNLLSIPAGKSAADIKEMLLTVIKDVPDVADITVTPDATEAQKITDATAANATAATIDVVFAITGDDYKFVNSSSAEVASPVTVTVNYNITAPATEINPTLSLDSAKSNIVLAAADTVDEATVLSKIPEGSLTVAATKVSDSSAVTLTDDDYDLTYTFDAAAGELTVGFKLVNQTAYTVKTAPAAVTYKVFKAVGAVSGINDVARQSFVKDSTDADAKAAIETAAKAKVAAILTGLTVEDDYTVVSSTPVLTTVTTTDLDATVTVTLKGIYVFDAADPTNANAKTQTFTVKYGVTDAAVTTKELQATYSAADRTAAVELAGEKPESGAYELTAADKTAINDAAIAIIKAGVSEITAGDFESTVTYGAVTGAVGAETVEATFTLTTAAQDEYTVKGGGTSVKVTVPVKYSGSTDVPGEDAYALNKAAATNGSFSFTVGGDEVTEAAEGDEVTIVTNPTRGYTLNKITVVNDDTDEEITVTSKKFTMPDASVTVTVTFKRASTSGGSSSGRPSSGSSSSSSSSSSTTPSVSDSETVKEITSTTSGGTAKLDGVVIMTTDAIKSAADKDVNLEVKVDDDYTWNIDADKLSDKNSVLRLSVSSATVNETETAKIKKSTSAEDRNEKAFSVVADNLGTGATLKVKTVSKSTDTVQKFANLYKTNADGTLTFVAAAPIDKDGNAVLPITDKGTYTIVASTETKMAGDINNDCKVDLTDLTAMLTKYVNNTDPKSFDDFKLDHDNSGELTLSDLVQMLRDYSNGKL